MVVNEICQGNLVVKEIWRLKSKNAMRVDNRNRKLLISRAEPSTKFCRVPSI